MRRFFVFTFWALGAAWQPALAANDVYYSSDFLKDLRQYPNPFPKVEDFVSIKGRETNVVHLGVEYYDEKGQLASWAATASYVSQNQLISVAHILSIPRMLDAWIIDDSGKKVRVRAKDWFEKGRAAPPWDPEFYEQLGLNQSDNDLSLLTIDDSKDQHGFYELYPLPPDSLIGKRVKIIGYPSMYVKENESTYDNNNKYSTGEVCKILAFKDGTLYTNCAAVSGLSGGPAIYTDDRGKEWLVGVLSSSIYLPKYGLSGSRITAVRDKAWIQEAVQRNGGGASAK